MLAGAGGRRCGQLSAGRGGGVADAFVGPDGGEDQDDGLVQGAAPGVAVSVRRPGGAAVLSAGGAELAEGDGVAARFGQEVTAVTEHVRPGPAAGAGAGGPELPGGGDQPPVV